MRQRAILAVLTVAALLLPACGGPDSHSGAAQVVVTTNILGDVVDNLVGDSAEVTVLMKRNADPHSFELSAQEADTTSRADLLVYNGLGLEEGVAHHVEAAAGRGVPTLAVGEHVGPIDFSEGDTAGAADPHFWTDPDRMITGVDAIEAALIEHLPDTTHQEIAANAAAYRAELQDLSESMRRQFAAIPPGRRQLVTNHHVLGYLAQRYGFTVVGAVVPSGTTLASPAPSDLDSLASAIRTAGVSAVFVDTSQPDRLARALATESGVDVDVVSLYSESLDVPGSEAGTYIDMMTANAERIVAGLTP